MKCRYDRAWCGACGRPCDDGSDICSAHKLERCCVCNAQATHECAYTGQFVCGAPLCDSCIQGDDGDSTKGLGWGFIGHTHKPRDPLPSGGPTP